MWSLFDHILFLAKGSVVYHGKAADAKRYFARIVSVFASLALVDSSGIRMPEKLQSGRFLPEPDVPR